MAGRDEWVALDGYVVISTTPDALALAKSMTQTDGWIWVPRSHTYDGNKLERGETDIEVRQWLADDRDLDY